MQSTLKIDGNGWLENVERIPSPNFEARPAGCGIDLIVVHAISLPPGEYGGGHVAELFCNQLDPSRHDYFAKIEELRVSAHVLITRQGHMQQFVSFLDRAWHAGASCWQERENCNDFSIGIELEGCDEDVFEVKQYQQLASLIHCLRETYPTIGANNITGHSDISPGRKTDPGPLFDWQKLHQTLQNLS